jgi:restriction system protein
VPIPDYQSVMLPFLAALSDRQEHNIRDLRKQLASQFKLTDQELEERIPSNRALLFDNRVGWARTYLGKAGLIDFVKRGTYRIPPRGIALLKLNHKNSMLHF